MEFKLVGEDVLALSGNSLVVSVYEERELGPIGKEIDVAMNGLLSDFLKDISFKAEVGKTVFMPGHGKVKFKNIIAVGLGKKEEVKADTIRISAANSLNKAKELKSKDITFENLGGETLGEKGIQWVVEGTILGDYKFEKYKSKDEDKKTEIGKICLLGLSKLRETIALGRVVGETTNFVRELVNEPGNTVKPADLADLAKKMAEKTGLKCTIYDQELLKKEKMQGILAVGQGSYHPPYFIHLAYTPKKSKKRIVLIGKGITFDSGGLNVKPWEYMKTMKCDKAGACAVLGIMKALAKLKFPLEVHGLIPAAENMPGGKAFRPDDIIVFKNNKSAEIHNTDAEGRLILADALVYGSNLKPDVMIDMATLTGACMVALGRYTTGIFCKDQELTDIFQKIGKETGENFWPLPLDEELKEEIKGTFSDIKNVGSRYGGAITAALFLKEFVSEDVKKWVHLDIAGPAFLEKPWKYHAEGATGIPVRTVINWLQRGASIGSKA